MRQPDAPKKVSRLMDGLYCGGLGDGMGWNGMYCSAVDLRGHHYGGSITTHKESHLFFFAGDGDRERQRS